MRKFRFIRSCFKTVLLLAFVSLFSMPLQANDRGINTSVPAVRMQPYNANQLPFASIATEVIRIISDVRGEVITDDKATLTTLGFSKPMVKEVVRRLKSFVDEKSHGRKSVGSSEVTPDSTPNAIVLLITAQLVPPPHP